MIKGLTFTGIDKDKKILAIQVSEILKHYIALSANRGASIDAKKRFGGMKTIEKFLKNGKTPNEIISEISEMFESRTLKGGTFSELYKLFKRE